MPGEYNLPTTHNSVLNPEKSCRKLWQFPWQYRESFIMIGGLVLVGLILQSVVGNFNPKAMRYPTSLYLFAALFLTSFAGFWKHPFIQWLTGIPLVATLIGSMLTLTLIMGITPQDKNLSVPVLSTLGFTQMTTSWPFVLIYITTLLSLGCVIVSRNKKRKHKFTTKEWGFLLNHLGIWLLLAAAGTGSADFERCLMYVNRGQVQWQGYDENNHPVSLPIAIKLHDFSVKIWPPKLALFSTATPFQPTHITSIDLNKRFNARGQSQDQIMYQLGDWEIIVEQYMERGTWAGTKQGFRPINMPGCRPALFVTARNSKTSEQRRGWLSRDWSGRLTNFLNLDENTMLAITPLEPMEFASTIQILTQKGENKTATVKVNDPVKIGHWMIYQHGYDNQAGPWSAYSSLELIYDPWLPVVYSGLAMMICGAVILILTGKSVRRVKLRA